MRIFEVLRPSANSSVPENKTWFRNLYEPLLDLEHEVVLFSAEEGKQIMKRDDSIALADFSQRLLDTFRKEHEKKAIDLFFSYLMDGMVEASVIDEIRKTGVPTCNFSCNNVHQFSLVDEISPHFDFNLHAERNVRDKFLSIGSNPVWWPMASNPNYFKPHDVPRTIDVSFVGANYALRARNIAHLLENEIDVRVFGPGWKRFARTPWKEVFKRYRFILHMLIANSTRQQAWASAHLGDYDYRRQLRDRFPDHLQAPITDEELIALYSRSHISLGFLEVYDQHDPLRTVKQHIHLREFEGPMAGALYCTGYMDELTEFFEPDKEIIVYRNQHELLDKVRYFLANPQEAEKIRQAGHTRALKEHTYHHRFKTLFAQLGLEN